MAPLAAPSQAFVPAWKRLGLKLKNHTSATEGPAVSAGPGSYEAQYKTQEGNIKSDRLYKVPTKSSASENSDHTNTTSVQNHTAASEELGVSSTRSLKRKKSVSFTPETKKASVISEPGPNSVSLKSKDNKRKEKKEKPERKDRKPRAHPVGDSPETPSYVVYLQDFHSARDHWRFNKAKQTALLKNIFNIFRVPPVYDDAVKSYLLGLQGQAARERLKQTARDILQETQEVGNPTADTIMTASDSHEEARARALKRQLKAIKGRIRDNTATEEARGDEYALKLRKRERAQIVLQALGNSTSPMSMGNLSTGMTVDGLEPDAKRLRLRSRKTRTGVPDDDDTDETSSVESIPSSTDTSSASDGESGEDEDGSDQDGSNGGSDSDSDETSSSSSSKSSPTSSSGEASGDNSGHSEESDSD